MKLTKSKVGLIGGLGTLLGTLFTYKFALQNKVDNIILDAQTNFARENYGLLDGYDANDLIREIYETLADPRFSHLEDYCNNMLAELNEVASTAVPYPEVYTMTDVIAPTAGVCIAGIGLTIVAYLIAKRKNKDLAKYIEAEEKRIAKEEAKEEEMSK